MDQQAWTAPTASSPVDAVVEVPGSKSVTNRALVLSAVADGPSLLRRPLHARDTMLMAQALRSLGVGGDDVDVPADAPVRAWRVVPRSLIGGGAVDCGLAGTVMRFVPPLAALADGPVRFDGDPRARERPMGPVLDALRSLGVRIDDDGRGALPFTVVGAGGVRGGEVVVDASSSSQFVSALLLVGARFTEGVTVRHVGPPMPSLPHIEMTVEMLRDRGVEVDSSAPDVWTVAPGSIAAHDMVIEPDLSNAGAFLAAAVVTGGRVTVPGWPSSTTQAGDALRDLLALAGASVALDPHGLTVHGGDAVHGFDADLHDVGELVPTVVAIALFADAPTTIRGVAHLRGHETDRLLALATEAGRLGGDVTETADGLVVRPRPLHGGVWRSYADHRMATAGALVGLRVAGVSVDDVATTQKTLPDFTDRWLAMLAGGSATP